jgi:hypothetical protein
MSPCLGDFIPGTKEGLAHGNGILRNITRQCRVTAERTVPAAMVMIGIEPHYLGIFILTCRVFPIVSDIQVKGVTANSEAIIRFVGGAEGAKVRN